MSSQRATLQIRQRAGERGAVMALAAISMLALILAVGLCVDISHFYVVRTELQNAADAAALSGASALNGSAGGINIAQQRAVAEMNKYEFNNAAVGITADDVYFATSLNGLENFLGTTNYPADTNLCSALRSSTPSGTVMRASQAAANPGQVRFVGVCAPATNPTAASFAISVITEPVPLQGKAIAGLSPPLTGICDIVAPMGLLDDPAINNTTEFTGTHTYTLRTNGGNSTSPGNYQLLEICGPGGNNVRNALLGNCDGCFGIGSSVCTKTGVTAGPVRQGWNGRFESDLVIEENITYATYQQLLLSYNPSSSNDSIYNDGGSDGRRLIIVPVIDKTAIEACNGSNCCLPIIDFAQFFLQKKVPGGNGGEIQAEFVKMGAVPSGTYDSGAAPITSLTLPVLYR